MRARDMGVNAGKTSDRKPDKENHPRAADGDRRDRRAKRGDGDPPASCPVFACRSLAQVRHHIDIIDHRLLDLLAERSAYVRQVVSFKSRDQIVDRKRIEEIIATVRGGAEKRGIDPDIIEAIWRTMIDRFIALEEKIFDDS